MRKPVVTTCIECGFPEAVSNFRQLNAVCCRPCRRCGGSNKYRGSVPLGYLLLRENEVFDEYDGEAWTLINVYGDESVFQVTQTQAKLGRYTSASVRVPVGYVAIAGLEWEAMR
jgi:hypothetical protein